MNLVDDNGARFFQIMSIGHDVNAFVHEVMHFGDFRQHLPKDTTLFGFIPDASRVKLVEFAVNDKETTVENLGPYDKWIWDHKDIWDKLHRILEFRLLTEELEQVTKLVNQFNKMESVFRETFNHPYFHKFIEIVVAVGQTLNQDHSIRTFCIESLDELDKVTSTTGNTNVLEYCKNLFRKLYPGQQILPHIEPDYEIPILDDYFSFHYFDVVFHDFIVRRDNVIKGKDPELQDKLHHLRQFSVPNVGEFIKWQGHYSSRNDLSLKHFLMYIGKDPRLVL